MTVNHAVVQMYTPISMQQQDFYQPLVHLNARETTYLQLGAQVSVHTSAEVETATAPENHEAVSQLAQSLKQKSEK